jgi:hypothetical protein
VDIEGKREGKLTRDEVLLPEALGALRPPFGAFTGQEGLTATDSWSGVVVRREPERGRETDKLDFDGLGGVERPKDTGNGVGS